jgi:hypothetical protein
MGDETRAAPLATYKEVRFDGKRLFELNTDSIRVAGSTTFQSSVDTTIPLNRIDPRVARLQIRHSAFWGGLIVAVVGFIAYEVLVSGFGLDRFAKAPGLLLGLGLVGVALCLATARKTEFAQFESDAGVPVLNIARAGPERHDFDAFVRQVLEQICKARSGG